MTRFFTMAKFHLRQMVAVPYFFQVMAGSVLSVSVVQYLAIRAWGGDIEAALMRSAAIGLWTASTASAGIIGFERYKGTLIYLVGARTSPHVALAALVSSATTFGLLSFPLAWVTWAALTRDLSLLTFSSTGEAVRLGALIAAIWVAGLAITLCIAALFVLTANAITYEPLLLTPVLFASGILFTTATTSDAATDHSSHFWAEIVLSIVPLRPVMMALISSSWRDGSSGTFLAVAVSLGVSVLWFVGAYFLMANVLRRATKTGELDLV